jgi:hypothetical protein
VVLQDVVYPCNTTLCFGGWGYEMLEKNTTSTFTNEIAELSKKFAISIILYIHNVPTSTCSRFAGLTHVVCILTNPVQYYVLFTIPDCLA